MARVLTAGSKVVCGPVKPKVHGGTLLLTTNPKLTISGKPVVVKVGPPITLCQTLPTPSTSPCLDLMGVPAGGNAVKLTVGKAAVLLDTFTCRTNGNPQGAVTISANQEKLTTV